jgi:drug/metabolite transporter (DMT)-like permease
MGPAFCLLSAAAFGAMAVFGKYAYDAGVGVGDLLLLRFGMAAIVLAAVATAVGAARSVGRRTVAAGLLLGGVGYATQAGLYFLALERMDASFLSLLLYTYPALVTVAAIVLGREQPTAVKLAAVGVASAGTALVLAGAGTGALDPLATVLGLGAAVAYTAYILTGDRVIDGVPPLALAALVTTGATVTFGVIVLATGGPALDFAAEGWAWLAAIALVSTVAAIILFFAGLARVGPSTAAILSTVEPPVTVTLAALAFGEQLTAVQLAGGALVLGTVVALNLPRLSAGYAAPAQARS